MTTDEKIAELTRLVQADELEAAWQVRRRILDDGFIRLNDNQLNRLVAVRNGCVPFDELCTRLDKLVSQLLR